MIFKALKLSGAYVISLELRCDPRGFFARTFCCEEFEQLGLDSVTNQCNMAYNKQKGILRGMHFQRSPHSETKIVRCVRGSVFDVIIDLRQDSPTFSEWFGVELNQDNRLALYIPKGLAHGYLTLSDHAEITYQVSESYHPECEGGVRWNDPAFNIKWPIETPALSEKDSKWPDFNGESL